MNNNWLMEVAFRSFPTQAHLSVNVSYFGRTLSGNSGCLRQANSIRWQLFPHVSCGLFDESGKVSECYSNQVQQ